MAEMADTLGITRSAISQYEHGLCSPSNKTIGGMALYLGIPASFLLTPMDRRTTVLTPFTFRSRSAKTKRMCDSVSIKMNEARDMMQYLFDKVELQVKSLPEDLFVDKPENLDATDIEGLAVRVREEMGIGMENISNLTTLLGNYGIACFTYPFPQKIDAVSETILVSDKKMPIIIFDSESSYFRQRFDLAHELGHILMHSSLDEDSFAVRIKDWENQANCFASAFLLPMEEFKYSVRGDSIEAVLDLKKNWGVSMAAIYHRMKDLKMITESRYGTMQVQMSYKKIRRNEPLDDTHPKESASLVDTAYRYIFENNLSSPSQVERVLAIRKSEMEMLTGSKGLFLERVATPHFSFATIN